MGLCKCPKKKVTNLFCFEHRVNVCENCLVANHERCIVKSYLQWLQDSDYNPLCTLCNKNLSDDACGECVRLTCYDVFHWYCLNKYAQQMPPNTAPAGYVCPCCKSSLFPAQNVTSPVAVALRQYLSKVNWARAGLGLPLIEETEVPKEPPAHQTESRLPKSPEAVTKKETTTSLSQATPNHTRPSAHVTPTVNQHSVISVDSGTTVRGSDKAYGVVDPRKVFDATSKDDFLNVTSDHDENKYKRRSAMEWLKNWLKSRDVKGRKKDPAAVRKKFFLLLLFGLIGLITVIIIFHKLGRGGDEDDPMLDMMANPNIRVNENRGQVLGD